MTIIRAQPFSCGGVQNMEIDWNLETRNIMFILAMYRSTPISKENRFSWRGVESHYFEVCDSTRGVLVVKRLTPLHSCSDCNFVIMLHAKWWIMPLTLKVARYFLLYLSGEQRNWWFRVPARRAPIWCHYIWYGQHLLWNRYRIALRNRCCNNDTKFISSALSVSYLRMEISQDWQFY